MKQYDLVVLGATGFTGRLVCQHIMKTYHGKGKFRWAIAGRNKEKLANVRSQLQLASPDSKVEDVAMIEADITHAPSLASMAAAAEVVVCTTGPYSMYGRPVVKACVENSANYCDLAVDAPFVRSIIDEFHEAAVASGVRIVHACGFDSVPSDVLTLAAAHYMQKEHGKSLGDVTLLCHDFVGGISGGTIESGVTLMNDLEADPAAKTLYKAPYALVRSDTGLRDSEMRDGASPSQPCWSPAAAAITGPFMMAEQNEKIVRMSNALLGWKLGKHMTYSERWGTGWLASLATTAMVALVAMLPVMAARYQFVRDALPAPGDGPSRDTMENGKWSLELWALPHEDAAVPAESDASCRVHAKMADRNRDPGYWSTTRMLLECALCMTPANRKLLEQDPYAGGCTGGVLSPSAAFGLTLHERLKGAGYELTVEDAAPGA